MKKLNWLKLTVSVITCLAAGAIGSMATGPKIQTWYAGVEKPLFSPPNWLFAPVWTILFILMGVALYLVWEGKGKNKKAASLWFGVQLVLNTLWSFLFFGWEKPGMALIEILVLWWAIYRTMREFLRINRIAGRLLIPYLGWVSFATVLNAAIWWLNK